MAIKTILSTCARCVIVKWKHYMLYKKYAAQFKHYLYLHHFQNIKVEGEDEYKRKWQVLTSRVEPYSYRYFSHYCGYNPDIVPEDIGHSYIEEYLNPIPYRKAYADKNLFPKIIGKEYVPRTIVCRINGGVLLDEDYCKVDKDLSEYIGNISSLILKPSTNTSSGRKIMKFEKNGNDYISHDGNIILTIDFLMSYQNDFCLQEAVRQHPFMSNLCSTSVNTIRLCLYRSVTDNESVVTAAIIRIGKEGSFVDNAHAGGMFIGVNVATGEMGKFVIEQYGYKKDIWNGIDFSKNSFVVPNWEQVIAFARYIGTKVYHHRLLALDIAMDMNGKPVLLEYNIGTFSYWLYMYTNQVVFGKYTDEIIDYCRRMKREKCCH